MKRPTIAEARAYVAQCVLIDFHSGTPLTWLRQWPPDEADENEEANVIHPLVLQAQRELEAHLQGLIRASIPRLTPPQVEIMVEIRDSGNPRPRYRANGSRRASLAGMTRAVHWLRSLGLIVPPRDDGPNTWTLSPGGREALQLALSRKDGSRCKA